MNRKRFENSYCLNLVTDHRTCRELVSLLKDQDCITSIKHIGRRLDPRQTITLSASGLGIIDTICNWFNSARNKAREINIKLEVESQGFVVGRESRREIKRRIADMRLNSEWGGFFAKESPFVWNLIGKISNKYGFDQDCQADIFQKVCLRVLRSGARVESKASARSFIGRVIHSVVTDEGRTRMREQKVFVQPRRSATDEGVEWGFGLLSEAIGGTTVDCYAMASRIARVAEEVLSKKEQKIFFSILVDNLSGKEVAEREEVPIGSIFTTLQRAKQKIRKRLSKEDKISKFFVTF